MSDTLRAFGNLPMGYVRVGDQLLTVFPTSERQAFDRVLFNRAGGTEGSVLTADSVGSTVPVLPQAVTPFDNVAVPAPPGALDNVAISDGHDTHLETV